MFVRISLVALVLVAATTVAATPVHIGKIIIRPLDVYAEHEAERGRKRGGSTDPLANLTRRGPAAAARERGPVRPIGAGGCTPAGL